MPYIPKDRRRELNPWHRSDDPETPGELNYTLAVEVEDYLKRKGINYTSLNEVLGVLTALQLELYRRLAAPYEDKKIHENGDVFGPALVLAVS